MARKPTPGADDGVWGTILNDYLNVAHEEDGSLRANSVTGTSIADGAVTDAKVAAAANIAQSKIAGLATSLDAKANANATVNLSGDQNVAGVKTFAASPVVPATTTANQAATKAYVDSTAANGARTAYPVVSNTNGTWPTFQSVYTSATLPLPMTYEVKWYVASTEQNATIPPQFESINAATRTIGGLHSIWGYPLGADGTIPGAVTPPAFVKQTVGGTMSPLRQSITHPLLATRSSSASPRAETR